MRQTSPLLFSCAVLGAAVLGGTYDTTAIAQTAVARTFVSGKGTDTGTCALAAPCRTFQYALSQTANGGEIIPLDSAGYGPVTINQSVSIINDGSTAFISVPSRQNGITVSSGNVLLRGITVDGQFTGANGLVLNGGNLIVQNCSMINFAGNTVTAGNGIVLNPVSGARVTIMDTTVARNGNDGIYMATTGTYTETQIIRANALQNGNYGMEFHGSSTTFNGGKVTVSNSVIAGNGSGLGFGALYVAAADALVVTNNGLSGIVFGTGSSSLGQGLLSASRVTGNGYGVAANSSYSFSSGNNVINGNQYGDISGSLGSAPLR